MKFLLVLVALAASLELTPDNWDNETAGKTIFVKFLAPWWGHCKRMKPDWDRLMADYKGHKTALVADVDCTAAGKPLCDSNGVKGFPTIKYGDPSALEDYKGGRSYDDLKKFADSNLKPMCSPANIDLCDDDKKKEIEDLMQLSAEDLDAKIAEGDKEIADAESHFKKEVEKLQAAYQKLMSDKDDTIEKVKSSGLGLMKSVLAAKQKAGDKDEL